MYASNIHSYTHLILALGIVSEHTVWGFITSQYPDIHDTGRATGTLEQKFRNAPNMTDEERAKAKNQTWTPWYTEPAEPRTHTGATVGHGATSSHFAYKSLNNKDTLCI